MGFFFVVLRSYQEEKVYNYRHRICLCYTPNYSLFRKSAYGLYVPGSGSRRGRVLPGLRFLDSLEELEIGFGIDKFVDMLDLEASVVIGGDLRDHDHFVVHVLPNLGLRVARSLRRDTTLGTSGVNLNSGLDTNMNDNPSRGFYDGMEGQLLEGLVGKGGSCRSNGYLPCRFHPRGS